MLDGLDARMPVGGLSDNCAARIGLVADSTSTGSPFSSTSRDFLLNTLFVWRIEDRDESMLASVVEDLEQRHDESITAHAAEVDKLRMEHSRRLEQLDMTIVSSARPPLHARDAELERATAYIMMDVVLFPGTPLALCPRAP